MHLPNAGQGNAFKGLSTMRRFNHFSFKQREPSAYDKTILSSLKQLARDKGHRMVSGLDIRSRHLILMPMQVAKLG
jgi:hypothetical protein